MLEGDGIWTAGGGKGGLMLNRRRTIYKMKLTYLTYFLSSRPLLIPPSPPLVTSPHLPSARLVFLLLSLAPPPSSHPLPHRLPSSPPLRYQTTRPTIHPPSSIPFPYFRSLTLLLRMSGFGGYRENVFGVVREGDAVAWMLGCLGAWMQVGWRVRR